MDDSEARAIAARQLEGFSTDWRPLALYPTAKDYGWCFVFGWNTKRYLETRNISDSMGPGTGPIAVVKANGDTWMLTSSPSVEDQLTRYADEHGIER